jgi:hypothetical protein
MKKWTKRGFLALKNLGFWDSFALLYPTFLHLFIF